MTVTLNPLPYTIVDGTLIDAVPVQSNDTTNYNNCVLLANAVNSNTVPVTYFRAGCIPTYTSANLFTVAPGIWIDSTGVSLLTIGTATTVNLAASGAGGLDTGSKTANTVYYLWICNGTSGTSLIFSASATTPTLPAGYNTYKAQLPFSTTTDGSGNALPCFVASGWPFRPWIEFFSNITVISAQSPTTSTTVPLVGIIPTISNEVKLITAAGAAGNMIFRPTGFTSYLRTYSYAINGGNPVETRTDANQNYDYYCSNNSMAAYHYVIGFLVTNV